LPNMLNNARFLAISKQKTRLAVNLSGFFLLLQLTKKRVTSISFLCSSHAYVPLDHIS
jgi:hypothetical protein